MMDAMKFVVLLGLALTCSSVRAGDEASPLGDPVLERPTLRCVGAYWIIKGDDDADAKVTVEYRKGSMGAWKRGPPLFRVEKGRHVDRKFGGTLEIPEGAWLFAGSLLMLEPDTGYELRLTLGDPDGGQAVKMLRARTRGEPVAPTDARIRHVIPAKGDEEAERGGSGAERDPIRGLPAAVKSARPGDVLLLAQGTYTGPVEINRSGEPGRPIIIRGRSADAVILDGQGSDGERPPAVIGAAKVHDVWLENLTIRNGEHGVTANDSVRIVVRGCRIGGVDYGITCTRNTKGDVEDFFIADNLIEGPSTWPRSKGIENARGIQLTGSGHVAAYNRVRGFADAIDTFNSPRCEAIDFHNNDVSELTDDGIELDFSRRNVRCFENRLTNVFQGISVQPVVGGPVYVLRNALFNVVQEPFKIHNSPSGVLFVHNTVVKNGPPVLVFAREPASNLFMRNNLFVGSSSEDGQPLEGYWWECEPKMAGCDIDYDGFAGGPFEMGLKWNGVRYRTFEEMKSKSPIERNGRRIEAKGLFASGASAPADPNKQFPAADLRPAAGSEAIDAGQALIGLNDGFDGKGADLGAYELGAAPPHYGPREPKGGR
jgi:hypothetical protein